jgi:ankyrin repeat protein
MLLEIEEELRPDAINLLRWVAYSRGPPSLDELVEVLVINLEEEGSVDLTDRPGLGDILEILRGLVIVIKPENVRNSENIDGSQHNQAFKETRRGHLVRLAHFSIKEYLESDRILRSSAKDFHLESALGNAVIARSCVVYLSHYRSSERDHDERSFDKFPLLKYAADKWPRHVAVQGSNSVTRVAEFLHNKESLRSWLTISDPDDEGHWLFQLNYDSRDVSQAEGLYYASLLDLPRVVEELIALGEGVNTEGGVCNTALQAASCHGNKETVHTLLKAGANVNARGGSRGSALQTASFSGRTDTVRTLLDAGANLNAQGGYYGNALQAASYKGEKEIMQILLNAGADANVQGGHYGNALQAASAEGKKGTVQILLKAGADVNAQGGYYGNALQAGSFSGKKETVQMLLSAGADVNAQGGYCGNALQAGSFSGKKETVQMLLRAGADVNAQGGYYGNALQAASAEGATEIVQTLLTAGADVNAQGGNYGHALQAASAKGVKETVQILIDAGAVVNLPGSRQPDALTLASFEATRAIGTTKVIPPAPMMAVADMTTPNMTVSHTKPQL